MTYIEIRLKLAAEIARSALLVNLSQTNATWASMTIRRTSETVARLNAERANRIRMTSTPAELSYSVEEASRLTGASMKALLAWERRYGFPLPIRKAGRTLRYPKSQVATLRSLVGLAEEGSPVGQLIIDHLAGRLIGNRS